MGYASSYVAIDYGLFKGNVAELGARTGKVPEEPMLRLRNSNGSTRFSKRQ